MQQRRLEDSKKSSAPKFLALKAGVRFQGLSGNADPQKKKLAK